MFGAIQCHPFQVDEVVAQSNLENEVIAVQGILFHGSGCRENEYLLLPKEGPFDGVGPYPMPVIDRSKCLLVNESTLYYRLGPPASGEYSHKINAIIIGRISFSDDAMSRLMITDLVLIVAQEWENQGRGRPYHNFQLILFNTQTPPLPWSGPPDALGVFSSITIFPLSAAYENSSSQTSWGSKIPDSTGLRV